MDPVDRAVPKIPSNQKDCWACRVRIHIPLVGEPPAPAPIFKCGWCGAMQETCPPPRKQAKVGCFKAVMKMLVMMNWMVVLLVGLLILSIVLPGATIVLPFTCPNPVAFALGHMVTFVLTFNVFFNFFAAMFHSPGSVREIYGFPDMHAKEFSPVAQDTFSDFTRCVACDFYKPPWVRHCYVCKKCIVDMDHHCPFIHNCVGRSNARNFILFLVWTVMSVIYCMLQSAWMLYLKGDELKEHLACTWSQIPMWYEIPLFGISFTLTTPWDILIPGWILWMSTGLLAMVGGLLHYQLRFGISPTIHSEMMREADKHHVPVSGDFSSGTNPAVPPPECCITQPRSLKAMWTATKVHIVFGDFVPSLLDSQQIAVMSNGDLVAMASMANTTKPIPNANNPSVLRKHATKVVGNIVNSRGLKLHTVSYVPEKRMQAKLVWHHGLGEHSGRYEKMFNRMAARGIAVHSYDGHGHGMSEPHVEDQRSLILDIEHMVDDLNLFLNSVDEEGLAPEEDKDAGPPETPCFLGGHSMGGLVTCLTAVDQQDRFAGVIMSSAAIDCEWTPLLKIQEPILSPIASLIPSLRIIDAVRAEDMSQDKMVVLESVMDPLCDAGGGLRVSTAKQMLTGFKKLRTQYKKLRLPIYAQHGTMDRCTRLEAVKDLIAACSSDDAFLHEVQGGFHELLHGPEWIECTDRFIDWMLVKAEESTYPTDST
eukprot:gene5305-18549_t